MRHTLLLLLTFVGLSATAQSKAAQVFDQIAERFTFTGYAQAGWEYHENQDPDNQFQLNKIIVMSNLRVTKRCNAFVMFDFKGFTLLEYWANFDIRPFLRVKFGQFKTPFSIENPLSPSILETIPQLSLATSHMVAGSSSLMMPASTGRDIGLTIYGDLGKYVSYDLALMNGAGRNRKDNNSAKDFAARLTAHPIPTLDISASTIIGRGSVTTLDSALRVTVDPGLTRANYSRNRFAAGAYLKTAPLHLRSEWMWGKDGEMNSNGGYLTAQANSVGVKGLDLIAAYDYLRLDHTDTNRFQAGIQYWFYKKCRVQLGYAYTKTDHLAGENAILTQIQVGF